MADSLQPTVNLNTRLFKELPAELELAQRGLYYGDCLFETIRVFAGRIPFMPLHWERLSRGLEAMRYCVPASWSSDFFEKEILRAAFPNARVRLTVWRSPGGLYLPENDTPQFLLTAKELDSIVFENYAEGLQVGLCDSVRLPVDSFSGLKSLNSARYVAAAQEAKARGWDDALILNAVERVCEATSSNLFWIKNDTVCTPPLTDGCVTGTLRFLLLALLREAGYPVVENPTTFTDILEADEVFLTNAIWGIRWVRECEGVVYSNRITKRCGEVLAAHLEAKLEEKG